MHADGQTDMANLIGSFYKVLLQIWQLLPPPNIQMS